MSQSYGDSTPVTTDEKGEPEQWFIWDWTGSEGFPIQPGSLTQRHEVLTPAVGVFQQVLFEADAAAVAAARAGKPEAELGGLRTVTIDGHEPQDLGDINPMNWSDKIKDLVPGGRTYIMDSIRLLEMRDREEIAELKLTQEAVAKRFYNVLVGTDGQLDDWDRDFGKGTFKGYVEHESDNKHFFFLLIGRGDDNVHALEHYQMLAEKYPNRVTVYDAQHVTNYDELAQNMLAMIG